MNYRYAGPSKRTQAPHEVASVSAAFAHEVAKAGNAFALSEFRRHVSLNDRVVYEAGCGEGRLFRHYLALGARRVVAAEPDELRWRHAARVAMALDDHDEATLEVLTLRSGEAYQSALKEVPQADSVTYGRITVVQSGMQDDSIAERTLLGEFFDVIISSHVFPHVTFGLVQHGLRAFHRQLSPNGCLVIFTTKANEGALQHLLTPHEGHVQLKATSRAGFADAFHAGTSLPIRYYAPKLIEQMLADPFASELEAIFEDEYARDESGRGICKFGIDAWVAYHCAHKDGELKDFDEAQRYFGVDGLKAADFPEGCWNAHAATAVHAFSMWMQSLINSDSTQRDRLLVDMMIVASPRSSE